MTMRHNMNWTKAESQRVTLASKDVNKRWETWSKITFRGFRRPKAKEKLRQVSIRVRVPIRTNLNIGKSVMAHPKLIIMRRILRNRLLISTVTLFPISLMFMITSKSIKIHLLKENQRPKHQFPNLSVTVLLTATWFVSILSTKNWWITTSKINLISVNQVISRKTTLNRPFTSLKILTHKKNKEFHFQTLSK